MKKEKYVQFVLKVKYLNVFKLCGIIIKNKGDFKMVDSIIGFLVDNSLLINSIASLFVIASAVFVGFQSKVFFNDYNKKHKKEEFENSFKLTQYYINNIIPQMSVILAVFKSIGVESILKNRLKNQVLSDFDKEEFQLIFEKTTIQDLCDMIKKTKLEVLLPVLNIDRSKLPGCLECDYHEYLKCNNVVKNKKQDEERSESYRKLLVSRFFALFTDTKNEIEYFSMYFNSNLAEEEVIFDSLHQTFIDFVRMLYPFIAMHNTKSVHGRKYFSNTIELYKRWSLKEKEIATKAKSAISAIEQGDLKHKKI